MAMLRHSLPFQIRGGYTLWVVLGKDSTRENYLAAKGYFQSGCRAAELLLGLLESCQACLSPDEHSATLRLQSSPHRQFSPSGALPPSTPIQGQLLP